MKNIIKLLFIFLIVGVKSQELKNDTLREKVTDIETVVINDKDYEKTNYSFGLKQENNVRLIPIVYYEEGVKFKNNLEKAGRISDVTIFFHKTDSKLNLTNLEINFYNIDPLTGKPGEKLNTQQIIYTPKNKKRHNVKVDVLNYNIRFPLSGVFVSIKWIPNEFNDKKVGPSLRETDYDQQITYVRFNNGSWRINLNSSRKQNQYTNAMIGLGVYIKKKKNNE